MSEPGWAIRVAVALLLLLLGGVGCGSSLTSTPGTPGSGGRTGVEGSGGSTGAGGAGMTMGSGGASAATGGSAPAGSGGSPAVGGASTGGAGGAAGVCKVTVGKVSGYEAIAGPRAVMRYEGIIAFQGPRAPVWTWQVTILATGIAVPVSHPTGVSSLIEFPIATSGSYRIYASVDTGVPCGSDDDLLTVDPPCDSCFVVRVRPPVALASSIPVQDQPIDVRREQTITLKSGPPVTFLLADTTRQAVASFVRVTTPSSGVVVEGYTGASPLVVPLLMSQVYDVLVIPDADLAPLAVSLSGTNLSGSMLTAPLPALDSGIPVTGTVRDGSGAPVAGATVVLRQGARPSTVGVSASDGSFHLWTRDGTLSALVSPPLSSGLPEARVAASPGIELLAGSPGLNLALAWTRASIATLSVAVKTAAGAPALGARVRVESEADLASVGTLQVSGSTGAPTSLTAGGGVRSETLVDATGVARFPNLATGRYRLTLMPAVISDQATLTTLTATLPPAGTTVTVPLAPAVMLSGTVSAASLPAGLRVIARDQGPGLLADAGPVPVANDGSYVLGVAPGRTYHLVADPPAGQGLARTTFATVTVGAGDMVVSPAVLPPATAVLLTVLGPDRRGLGAAAVQVYCVDGNPTCADSTLPVAEAITARDGTVTVSLP